MEEENEIDLFDEFKVRPITKGLGFHKKDSQTKGQKFSSLAKKAKPLQVSTAPASLSLNSSEENKQPIGSSLNTVTSSHSKSLSSASKHSNQKIDSPGFSSLDRQLMEMNALMEELNHSFSEKKIKDKKEPELLDLEWEESPKEELQKKTQQEPFSLLSASSPSPSKELRFLKKQKRREFAKEKKVLSSSSVLSRSFESTVQERTKYPTKKALQKEASPSSRSHLPPPSSGIWTSAFFPHIGVLIVDTLMSLGFSLTFFLSLIYMIQVDVITLTLNLVQGDSILLLCLMTLYLSHLFVYLIVARGFFGQSLGEWAFGYRIGSHSQRRNPFYPFLVLWRLLVVFVTGIFTFPLLSLLFKKDLTFYLTGLPLQKRKNPLRSEVF